MDKWPQVVCKQIEFEKVEPICIKKTQVDGQPNYTIESGASIRSKETKTPEAANHLDSSTMFPGSCESRSPSPCPISPRSDEEPPVASTSTNDKVDEVMSSSIHSPEDDSMGTFIHIFKKYLFNLFIPFLFFSGADAENLLATDSALQSVIPLTPETPAAQVEEVEEEEEEAVVSALTTPVNVTPPPAELPPDSTNLGLNSPVSEPAVSSSSSSSTEDTVEDPDSLPKSQGALRLVSLKDLMSPSHIPPVEEDEPIDSSTTQQKTRKVSKDSPGPMVAIPGHNLATMLVHQETTTSTIIAIQQEQQQQPQKTGNTIKPSIS